MSRGKTLDPNNPNQPKRRPPTNTTQNSASLHRPEPNDGGMSEERRKQLLQATVGKISASQKNKGIYNAGTAPEPGTATATATANAKQRPRPFPLWYNLDLFHDFARQQVRVFRTRLPYDRQAARPGKVCTAGYQYYFAVSVIYLLDGTGISAGEQYPEYGQVNEQYATFWKALGFHLPSYRDFLNPFNDDYMLTELRYVNGYKLTREVAREVSIQSALHEYDPDISPSYVAQKAYDALLLQKENETNYPDNQDLERGVFYPPDGVSQLNFTREILLYPVSKKAWLNQEFGLAWSAYLAYYLAYYFPDGSVLATLPGSNVAGYKPLYHPLRQSEAMIEKLGLTPDWLVGKMWELSEESLAAGDWWDKAKKRVETFSKAREAACDRLTVGGDNLLETSKLNLRENYIVDDSHLLRGTHADEYGLGLKLKDTQVNKLLERADTFDRLDWAAHHAWKMEDCYQPNRDAVTNEVEGWNYDKTLGKMGAREYRVLIPDGNVILVNTVLNLFIKAHCALLKGVAAGGYDLEKHGIETLKHLLHRVRVHVTLLEPDLEKAWQLAQHYSDLLEDWRGSDRAKPLNTFLTALVAKVRAIVEDNEGTWREGVLAGPNGVEIWKQLEIEKTGYGYATLTDLIISYILNQLSVTVLHNTLDGFWYKRLEVRTSSRAQAAYDSDRDGNGRYKTQSDIFNRLARALQVDSVRVKEPAFAVGGAAGLERFYDQLKNGVKTYARQKDIDAEVNFQDELLSIIKGETTPLDSGTSSPDADAPPLPLIDQKLFLTNRAQGAHQRGEALLMYGARPINALNEAKYWATVEYRDKHVLWGQFDYVVTGLPVVDRARVNELLLVAKRNPDGGRNVEQAVFFNTTVQGWHGESEQDDYRSGISLYPLQYILMCQALLKPGGLILTGLHPYEGMATGPAPVGEQPPPVTRNFEPRRYSDAIKPGMGVREIDQTTVIDAAVQWFEHGLTAFWQGYQTELEQKQPGAALVSKVAEPNRLVYSEAFARLVIENYVDFLYPFFSLQADWHDNQYATDYICQEMFADRVRRSNVRLRRALELCVVTESPAPAQGAADGGLVDLNPPLLAAQLTPGEYNVLHGFTRRYMVEQNHPELQVIAAAQTYVMDKPTNAVPLTVPTLYLVNIGFKYGTIPGTIKPAVRSGEPMYHSPDSPAYKLYSPDAPSRSAPATILNLDIDEPVTYLYQVRPEYIIFHCFHCYYLQQWQTHLGWQGGVGNITKLQQYLWDNYRLLFSYRRLRAKNKHGQTVTVLDECRLD